MTEMDDFQIRIEGLESDLQTAASIGKALLEKNSKLEHELEETHRRYSERLEAKDDECYKLQRKLDCSLQMEKSLVTELESLKQELCRQKQNAEQQAQAAATKLRSALEEVQEQTASARELSNSVEHLQRQVTLLEAAATIQREPQEDAQEEDNTTRDQLAQVEAQHSHLLDLLRNTSEQLQQAQAKATNLENCLLEEQKCKTIAQEALERAQLLQSETARECKELKEALDALQTSQGSGCTRGNSLFGEVEERRLELQKELDTLRRRHRSLQERVDFLRSDAQRTRCQMATLLAPATARRLDAAYVEHLQSSLQEAKQDLARMSAALSHRAGTDELERERAALYAARARQIEREQTLARKAREATREATALRDQLLRIQLTSTHDDVPREAKEKVKQETGDCKQQ
ncbi:protein Spindly-like [Ornithodoros turicata]|uniref:protein Spindly-like n=1 Tax=Ornithodoros turicata TaxID=34597 RepID=UPI0031394FC7